jgi:hypothetical protein
VFSFFGLLSCVVLILAQNYETKIDLIMVQVRKQKDIQSSRDLEFKRDPREMNDQQRSDNGS